MTISNIKVQISDKQTITAPTMKSDESQGVVVRWTKRRGNQEKRVNVDAASVSHVHPRQYGQYRPSGAAPPV